MKNKITEQKNKLMRYSDHEEDEDVIDLLMELEVNEKEHLKQKEVLSRRIEELENIIEFLVDNYDIDLREIANVPRQIKKAGFGGVINSNVNNKKMVVTNEMWLEATKQRRREKRLGDLLDEDNKKEDLF